MLDLTNLDDGCSDEEVVSLCSRALTPWGAVAAVCVWPAQVGIARRELSGSAVRVATVVNFPHGSGDVESVVDETKRAMTAGAHEIDVVAPFRALIDGDESSYGRLVSTVRSTVGAGGLLKVILETGELGDPALVDRAARIAVDCGADFVKTSTGKTPVSATLESVLVMLRVIHDCGRPVGIKPSGGIRTFEDAARYLDLAESIMGPSWAMPDRMRFGASSLLNALERELA